MTDPTTRRRTRGFVATLVAVLLLSLVPVLSAEAAEPTPGARDVTQFACPPDQVPESDFTDIEGSTFESEIECLVWYDITQGGPAGRPANQYGPDLDVRRDQMATFIARTLDYVDPLILGPYDGENDFTDVPDDSVHVESINRLSDKGVVAGGPAGRPEDQFGPDLDVSRGQMASFINRAIGAITGAPFSSTTDYFDDDNGSTHEDNINGLAENGIVQGRALGVYAPDDNVRREAMSAFIMRTMDYLIENDHTENPAGGDLAELTGATVTDADADGVLSAGDSVLLQFSDPVAVASSLTLTDDDGDVTTLSDDGTDGSSSANFEAEGDTVEVTLLENPTVSGDGDGQLDGSLDITECSGIVSDADGDGEVDEGETEVDCAAADVNVEIPEPTGPAQLISASADDADESEDLSSGDTITLQFNRPVVTESTVNLTDDQGDTVELSDEGGIPVPLPGDGTSAAAFAAEGNTVTVTLEEDPEVTEGDPDGDGAINGTVTVGECTGIVTDDDGDGEAGEEEEPADCASGEKTFQLGGEPPDQQADVTLDSSTVEQGSNVSGDITGDGVDSATVSGCGLTNEPVQDRDTSAPGIQFEETIPASQPTGQCTLTFTVSFDDGTPDEEHPEPITVVPAGSVAGRTNRPELLTASIISTVVEGNQTPQSPKGTRVRYKFDEPLTGGGPVAAEFLVYNFDSSVMDTGDEAIVDSADNTSVLVRFIDIDTATQAQALSVATVDIGAVKNSAQATNPEGDAALNVPASGVLAGGVTEAPDLLSISGFLDPPNDQGNNDFFLNFHFDEPAWHVASGGGGYHVITATGTDVECTFNEGPVGGSNGDGTMTHQVTCEPDSAVTSEAIARATVDAETVSDARADEGQAGGANPITDPPEEGCDPSTTGDCSGNLNPLQAVAGPSIADGDTETPDLDNLTFLPNATPNADQVLFSFDEGVNLNIFGPGNPNPSAPTSEAAVGARFNVYDINGDEIAGTTAAAQSNDPDVLVTFPDGALDEAVGGSVEDGAVIRSSGSSPPANQQDELPEANTRATTNDGRTDGPDLTTMTLFAQNDGFGNTQDYVGVYAFDEPLSTSQDLSVAANVNKFRLWLQDGALLVCTAAAYGTQQNFGTNTVQCTEYRRASVVADPPSGLSGTAAPKEDLALGRLGTVDGGAVDDAGTGTNLNPEGAAPSSIAT